MKRFPLSEHKLSPATAANAKQRRIVAMLECGMSRGEIAATLKTTYAAISGQIDRMRQRERDAAHNHPANARPVALAGHPTGQE